MLSLRWRNFSLFPQRRSLVGGFGGAGGRRIPKAKSSQGLAGFALFSALLLFLVMIPRVLRGCFRAGLLSIGLEGRAVQGDGFSMGSCCGGVCASSMAILGQRLRDTRNMHVAIKRKLLLGLAALWSSSSTGMFSPLLSLSAFH